MTSRKYFFVLLAVFILLIGLIIGAAVGGNILLQKRSAKLTEVKTETKAVEAQQTALIQAKKDVERYSDLEKIVKSVVPQDKDQAKTVREIVTIAAQNKIPIKSVSFPSSTLGDKAPAGSPQAKTNAPTQLTPVEGITGVYSLEIEVESAVKVPYKNFLSFLNDLEKNRRTAHVASIDLTPDPKENNNLDFKLTLNAYVKP